MIAPRCSTLCIAVAVLCPLVGLIAAQTIRTRTTTSRLKAQGPTAATTPYGNPLPPELHTTIPPSKLLSGRLVVVGDVHGCHDELGELLGKVGFVHGIDNLILVGDLVNKGPESAQVVATARKLGALAVRGNHDEAALAAWGRMMEGGKLPEKYNYLSEFTHDDLAWLRDLPFSIALPGYGVRVVHAGMVPGVPRESQLLNDCILMRDLVRSEEDGTKRWLGLEDNIRGSVAWGTKWEGPEHLIYGHDARRKLQLHPYATGLDSGCCYGFSLTACVVPPLSQLSQLNPDLEGQLRKGVAPSRDDLHAEIVSVLAKKAYSQPKGND